MGEKSSIFPEIFKKAVKNCINAKKTVHATNRMRQPHLKTIKKGSTQWKTVTKTSPSAKTKAKPRPKAKPTAKAKPNKKIKTVSNFFVGTCRIFQKEKREGNKHTLLILGRLVFGSSFSLWLFEKLY